MNICGPAREKVTSAPRRPPDLPAARPQTPSPVCVSLCVSPQTGALLGEVIRSVSPEIGASGLRLRAERGAFRIFSPPSVFAGKRGAVDGKCLRKEAETRPPAPVDAARPGGGRLQTRLAPRGARGSSQGERDWASWLVRDWLRVRRERRRAGGGDVPAVAPEGLCFQGSVLARCLF